MRSGGWLVVNKPLGCTSADVVRRLKRSAPLSLLSAEGAPSSKKALKIGHSGTLDPMASGVLLIGYGEATKAITYLDSLLKTYRFCVRFGIETSTSDQEGSIVRAMPSRPSLQQIKAALPAFVGRCIAQRPPAFSAVKVNGKRAHALARQGQSVEMPERLVNIERLDFLNWVVEGQEAQFEVVCGSGTYVRALATDMAAHLGTCGYVSALCRTAIGPFGLSGASCVENAWSNQRPLSAAFHSEQCVEVGAQEAEHIRFGRAISRPEGLAPEKVLLTHQNKPIAFILVERDYVRPLRVLNF